MKARGVTTIIWVLNSEEELTEINDQFGDSLDGIMTDKPTMVRKWIDNNQGV